MANPGVVDLSRSLATPPRRPKGWTRRSLTILILSMGLNAAFFGWRSVSLWGLPNAPEPFDLARYGRVDVADGDNAMVAYRPVFGRFGDLDIGAYKVNSPASRHLTDWSAASPEVRRWAEDHRKALDAWLPTNDRPDSLLVQPEDLRMRSDLNLLQLMRPYVRLALLEGSRLEQSGDLDGAWRMYRAALLASRHAARHGGINQRLMGASFLRQCRTRIDAWITLPGIRPERLHQAIRDVEACRAMTSPTSEMIRAEYFSARDALFDTDRWMNLTDTGSYSNVNWYNQLEGGRWAYRFLRREPERSARILRLITAGYLAQCDRLPARRPALVFPFSMIYAHDARTPEPVRAISPVALEAWSRDSMVLYLNPFSNQFQPLLDGELNTFDHLALEMAERAFLIERGRPPSTYGELLGPYLKTLPDGIEPQDALSPPSK